MHFSYRAPRFWQEFSANHWTPRVPTVLRQPFREFPFSEAAVLRALHRFAGGIKGGDQRKHCLVSLGDRETAPRRPLRALFREPSESFDALEARMARVFPGKAFGLMVTQMQAVDSAIWNPLTAVLQDAAAALELPVPRAFLDLFYGNYSSRFTGLHKDTQEILAFVVRGEKRMLAWPFEYFLERVPGLSAGDRFFNKRLAVDPARFRKDAIVLDAKAGDVFYWPADYWHVAEPRGGFSAMVSLGLYRPAPSAAGNPNGRFLRSQDVTAAFRDVEPIAKMRERLRWISGHGFEMGGPLEGLPRSLPEGATFAKNTGSVLLWRKEKGGRLFVAANGHSIALPASAALLATLKRLAGGEAVSVPPHRPRAEAMAIAETSWNDRCELETAKRTTREPVPFLLRWLLRVNAVAAVSGP